MSVAMCSDLAQIILKYNQPQRDEFIACRIEYESDDQNNIGVGCTEVFFIKYHMSLREINDMLVSVE